MSDSKFDDKIRETLEGHEPDESPNWDKMRDRIAAAAAIGAMGVDAAGSKIATQLSIGAAVVIGAASMWVAQNFIELEEDIPEEVTTELIVEEEAQIPTEEVTTSLDLSDNTSSDSEDVQISELSSESDAKNNSSESFANSKTAHSLTYKSNTSNGESMENEMIRNANKSSVENSVVEEVPFNTSTQTSCVGAQVEFEVEGSDINVKYLWNFGDGSFSSEPNPTHTYEMPGIYDVTLSLITPGEGAIKTRTIENLITINPQPDAHMSWTFPRIITGNKVPVELIDNTIDANDATWIVDGEILGSSSPVLNNPGKYQVNLIASNQFGCQDHTSNEVIIGNRNQLNAPARFSPDGDGRYDSFMPFGLKGMTEKWELVIADDQGAEVYSATSFDSPWTGEIANGELAENASVYFWTVVCIDFDGNKRVYSDMVMVER